MSFRRRFIVLFLATCAVVQAQGTSPRGISEVPVEFRQLYEFPLRSADASVVIANLPCDAIILEFACVGGCAYDSGYKLTLNKSLQADLHRNSANRPRFGETGTGPDYSGTVNALDFGKLCQMAKQPAFDAIQPLYSTSGADGVQSTVAIRSGATTKVITERNATGPIELWQFERSLEAVAYRIRWVAK